MKKGIVILLLLLAFVAGCKKTPAAQDELSKLPPATQIGSNTFGCLLNGKVFLPSGYDGSKPNFHVIADPNNGDLLIESYRYINGNEERIYFGANNIKAPGSYPIINLGNTSVGYSYQNCYIIFIDSIYRQGYINVSKYDIGNGILSGTFEAHLYRPSCGDTIHITSGRFDKKL
ncbi:MAG TPA: hypothetical protein VMY77_18930 [Chitinophagaceae bacterium]|nr:hypothetical protein [Chitinophagaceae bacterium]